MKLNNLLGVVFVLPGLFMAVQCANDLAHCTTLMFLGTLGMIAVGCTIFDNTTVINALKSLLGVAGPYIRIGDPRDRQHDHDDEHDEHHDEDHPSTPRG